MASKAVDRAGRSLSFVRSVSVGFGSAGARASALAAPKLQISPKPTAAARVELQARAGRATFFSLKISRITFALLLNLNLNWPNANCRRHNRRQKDDRRARAGVARGETRPSEQPARAGGFSKMEK